MPFRFFSVAQSDVLKSARRREGVYMRNETLETPPPDQGSRTMPDFVKRGLIRVQGGLLYLKAPYRVLWMREEHPDWSVVTSIEYADWEKGFAVVRAVIMDGDGRILATAHS